MNDKATDICAFKSGFYIYCVHMYIQHIYLYIYGHNSTRLESEKNVRGRSKEQQRTEDVMLAGEGCGEFNGLPGLPLFISAPSMGSLGNVVSLKCYLFLLLFWVL